MNEGPTIRPMTVEDLDDVMKTELRAFADPWSRKSYLTEITENDYSRPVIMEFQGEIVGHAVVWEVYEEFHIATLAVSPDFQGQGLGNFLFQNLLKMTESAEFALLEVRKSNMAAIKMYEKFGFVQIGFRRQYYRNGEDAMVMKKIFDR